MTLKSSVIFEMIHASKYYEKNNASEDWIVLDVIIKHSIKIFAC